MRGTALVLAFLLIAPALAQPTLSLSTDSPIYEPGALVTIIVKGRPGAPVGLEVRDPSAKLVALEELTLNASGLASFRFQLGAECEEGTYTVYAATPGAFAQTSFLVARRPAPALLLAVPGRVGVGKEFTLKGFVYPGLPLQVLVYVKPPLGEWKLLGRVQANASGWFTASFKPDREGVYLLRAEYNGSMEYAPASSTTNFTASRAPPPEWEVRAPSQAWLGDTVVINCSGCEYVLARTVAGERLIACGSRVTLNVSGPWVLYPVSGNALGAPTILIVRARVSVLLEGPAEVGVGEPFYLRAYLTPPVQALRVRFECGGRLLEALSRANGTAVVKVSLADLGEYEVRAGVQPTSIFEAEPSNLLIVRVVGERVYVRIIVVDAKGRRLNDAVVEVGGVRLNAWMGVAETVVKAGDYNVRVLWRGLTVYTGKVRLVGGNVTITAPLYDLEVKVLDFLGRQAAGEIVELYNGTEMLAAVPTDEEGKVIFPRLPPGTYTIRAGGVAVQASIPDESSVTMRLPPPPWLPLVAILLIIAAIAVSAGRRGRQNKKRKVA